MRTNYAYLKSPLLGALIAFVASTGVVMAADATPPQDTSTPTTPSETTTPASSTDSSTQSDAEKQDPRDKVVCRKEPPPTGSRMGGRKICRTAREWQAIQSEAREVTEDLQRNKAPDVTR